MGLAELAIIKQKKVAFARVSIRWSFRKWYIADLNLRKLLSTSVVHISTYLRTYVRMYAILERTRPERWANRSWLHTYIP